MFLSLCICVWEMHLWKINHVIYLKGIDIMKTFIHKIIILITNPIYYKIPNIFTII